MQNNFFCLCLRQNNTKKETDLLIFVTTITIVEHNFAEAHHLQCVTQAALYLSVWSTQR